MAVNNDYDRDVTFEIIDHLGALATYPTGWRKELNLVSWNGGAPKYDIRDPHNTWFANNCRISEDLLAPVWKQRLEEYVEPELTEDRKAILRRLLPENYHSII